MQPCEKVPQSQSCKIQAKRGALPTLTAPQLLPLLLPNLPDFLATSSSSSSWPRECGLGSSSLA